MDRKRELKEQYRNSKPPMGIVAFSCLPTEKTYLACAKDTKAVINSKRFQLENGSCFNRNMQADWNAYGAAGFDIRVVETLEYDKDEAKTDYNADLAALRDICREGFRNCEFI
ncbi:MAG: GIY-YIG nuclease family protein [Clostridiales bacterium]|nr:GIY-YIG nuclease family protein [Clostridiales bacterium]